MPTLDPTTHLPVFQSNVNPTTVNLFNSTTATGKTVNSNVDFELQYDDNTGYYEYNSYLNQAQLNQNYPAGPARPAVYHAASARRKRRRNIFRDLAFGPLTISTTLFIQKTTPVGTMLVIPWTAAHKVVPDTDTGVTDVHFGMSMEVPFVIPVGGQIVNKATGQSSDMIFDFSGDDDVWVYIDGKLALDLGGAHQPVGGSINFRTGAVTTNADPLGADGNTVTHYNINGSGTYAPNLTTGAGNLGISLAAGTAHTMSIFYLERYAGESNLHMRFNIQAIPKDTVSVSKVVTDTAGNPIPAATYGDIQYPYKLYVTDQGGSEHLYTGPYTVGSTNCMTDTTGANAGVMYIKAGETAAVASIPITSTYRFVELVGAGTDFSTQWTTGSTFATAAESGSAPNKVRTSSTASVGSAPHMTFKNIYSSANFQSLVVTKQAATGINGTFTFHIDVKNGISGTYMPYVNSAIGITDGTFTLTLSNTIRTASKTITSLLPGNIVKITETLDPSVYDAPVYASSASITNTAVSATVFEGTIGTLPSGSNHTITCTNRLFVPKTNITIKKVDKNGASLANATFTVNGTSYTTDLNGTFTFEATQGTQNYIIQETVPPAGYTAPAGSFTVPITYTDATHTVAYGAATLGSYTGLVTLDAANKMIIVKNMEIKGSITVTKKIDQFYAPNGNAVFFFRLENTTTGEVRTKYVEFSNASDVGYDKVGLAVTFSDLPLGTYTLTESNPIRYALDSISNVSSNGSISGASVNFTLTANSGQTTGSVIYKDTRVYEKNFSHTDVVKNQFTINWN